LIITALKPTKNKKRFNLYLDNHFVFSLDPELVLTQGLKLNQNLTQTQLDQLFHQAFFIKLHSRALNFISFRPRSVQELRFYLHRYLKKNSQLNSDQSLQLLEKVIKKLKQQKLLDDQHFVDWWLNQRLTHKPKGNLALKAELFQKGIDRQLINQHLLSSEQEKALAFKTGRQKLSRFSSLSAPQQKTKLIQFLRSRGFSSQTIFSVVDELISKG